MKKQIDYNSTRTSWKEWQYNYYNNREGCVKVNVTIGGHYEKSAFYIFVDDYPYAEDQSKEEALDLIQSALDFVAERQARILENHPNERMATLPTKEAVYEALYPHLLIGERVKFLWHKEEDPQPLTPGELGTITHADKYQLCVKWDSGRGLNLIPGSDEYAIGVENFLN